MQIFVLKPKHLLLHFKLKIKFWTKKLKFKNAAKPSILFTHPWHNEWLFRGSSAVGQQGNRAAGQQGSRAAGQQGSSQKK
jgi:hypothetical protein